MSVRASHVFDQRLIDFLCQPAKGHTILKGIPHDIQARIFTSSNAIRPACVEAHA